MERFGLFSEAEDEMENVGYPWLQEITGLEVRVHARITSHVWVLRHPSGKGEDCAYSSFGKDEQRRQTRWIDAQTWEVIFARALSTHPMLCALL